MHALRTLQSHGLAEPALQEIFRATALAKITYCSPAWRGFLSATETNRLDGFMRKAVKSKFCSDADMNITLLFDKADRKLFKSIVNDPIHVLHYLLPPRADHSHNLRHRAHNYQLSERT